jgi:heme-degrading monooxygenase HmoA
MISRIWHGWTTPENADTYESLLKNEIFSGIQSRLVDGYKGIHLLRRDLGDEVEFITIMWFDSIDDVRVFVEKSTERPSSHKRQEPYSRDSIRTHIITM